MVGLLIQIPFAPVTVGLTRHVLRLTEARAPATTAPVRIQLVQDT